MPTIEVKKAQVDCKDLQLIVELTFPPKTLADGSVTYGRITNLESKGVDADGNQAGNVYWDHDEIFQIIKQKLIGVLLQEAPAQLATGGVSIDLTPTPFEAPVVEEEVIAEPV